MVRNSDSTKIIEGFDPSAHPGGPVDAYARARKKGVDKDYIHKIDNLSTFQGIYPKKG
jgi:hypothetical protein